MPTWDFANIPEETEHNHQFRTHAAYQDAFLTLALGQAQRSRGTRLVDLAARANSAYDERVARRSPSETDLATVRSCLHRAWGTESLLNATVSLAPDSDIIRLALAWGAVQTYYSCYNAVQSVLVAEGKSRKEAHNATQKEYVDLWVMRRSIVLAPWSLAAVEPGSRLACAGGFLNGPGRDLDANVHPWASREPGREWDVSGKALRTTRNDHVKEAQKEARERKRRDRRRAWQRDNEERILQGRRPKKEPNNSLPQLTAAEKSTVRQQVRPYTLLDYLYRLRIKANYLDADFFSQGPYSDGAAARFATGMQDVTASSLLVHELRVARLLGKDWLESEALAWLENHPGASRDRGLGTRMDILAND